MAGFIYLWYDRKHRRFYLGKHWGDEGDGYVCSSSWMKRAYKRRPQDFRRRIVEMVFDREELGDAEARWGALIKQEELGKRYYNLTPPGRGQWHDDPEKRLTVGQKISRSHRNMSAEEKRLFVEKSQRNRVPKACHTTPHSLETRARISQKLKGRLLSEETRRKMSESRRGKKRGPYKK